MAVEDRLVAIIGTSGDPVGTGLLIDDDLVLTCSHVVNVAQGRGKYEEDRPGTKDRPSTIVKVRAHGSTDVVDSTIDPAEDAWWPPPASKSRGDLCILRLPAGTAGGKGPATLRQYSRPERRTFRAVGYPVDWKTADVARGSILGRDEDGLYMLRSEEDSPPSRRIFSHDKRPAGVIYTGFSGAPVESGGVIVGLLTMARDPADVTAYMIPVSRFSERFAQQTERYPNRVFEDYQHVEKLCADARKRLAAEPFDIRLRYCKDFEEALNVHRTSAPPASGKYDDTLDLTALLFARALHQKNGTFLLHGPGGGGKSSFLLDLILTAPDENLLPFLLDFSSPRKPGSDTAAALPEEQLRQWFGRYRAFGTPDDLLDLGGKEPDEDLKVVLVVDGVNQAHVQVSDVLATIAALSIQALARVRIIVSDRMVDRGTAVNNDFGHAVIPPLAPAAYEEALRERPQSKIVKDDAWRAILSSPMFLDLLLTLPASQTPAEAVVPSRFQILYSYYRDKCKFDRDQLRTLADFAFSTYEDNRQTAIPKKALNSLGDSLNHAIEQTDLIQELGEDDKQVEFRHQLLHDALAALKIASASETDEAQLLRGPAFDIVSLDASSPDAIELAVEAVQHPEDLLGERQKLLEPREFLSEVFDWNFRITLQCVASFDRRGDSPLPQWVRHAVYAHNLERRFDPFLHTALLAERMKALIPVSPDVDPYLDAGSRDEIVKSVHAIIQALPEKMEGEEAYRQQWLEFYGRTESFPVKDLRPLWSDPFLSWMTANAMRRFEIGPEVTTALIQLYESSRKTSERPKFAPKAAAYRWRLVHTLGRGTTAGLVTLLDATLDPIESADVRYGAVRSLIELAVMAASSEERRQILDGLRDGLPRLFEGDGALRVRLQLRRACAFNENKGCAIGREGWLQDWLAEGLPQFATLLHDGEVLAKEPAEVQSWRAWATAADQVAGMKEWTLREKAWRQVIEKEL